MSSSDAGIQCCLGLTWFRNTVISIFCFVHPWRFLIWRRRAGIYCRWCFLVAPTYPSLCGTAGWMHLAARGAGGSRGRWRLNPLSRRQQLEASRSVRARPTDTAGRASSWAHVGVFRIGCSTEFSKWFLALVVFVGGAATASVVLRGE